MGVGRDGGGSSERGGRGKGRFVLLADAEESDGELCIRRDASGDIATRSRQPSATRFALGRFTFGFGVVSASLDSRSLERPGPPPYKRVREEPKIDDFLAGLISGGGADLDVDWVFCS
jgi:hypothetical protein